MNDEPLSKNEAMKRILAKSAPIPPPKGYPIKPKVTEEQVELELRLWEKKVGRR